MGDGVQGARPGVDTEDTKDTKDTKGTKGTKLIAPLCP